MRALTHHSNDLTYMRHRHRSNEVLAREGIDTHSTGTTQASSIYGSNEVLAREGIDTGVRILL